MEENIYSKFGFNVFLAVIVFFYAGIVGVIASLLHIVVSCVIFILDKKCERMGETEQDNELEDLIGVM